MSRDEPTSDAPWRRTPAAAAAVLLAVLLAGCTDGTPTTDESESGNPRAGISTASPEVMGGVVPGADTGVPALPSAVALRLSLEQRLAAHALVLGDAIRSEIAPPPQPPGGAEDAARAAREVAAVFESIYGIEGGESLLGVFTRMDEAALAAATAVRVGDAAALSDARGRLDSVAADAGALLSGLTRATAPADRVTQAMADHTLRFALMAEAAGRGDHEAVWTLQRDAHAQGPPLGFALASALAAAQPLDISGPVQGPAVDLRSQVGQVLGEHVMLTAFAVRATVDAAPDRDHIVLALGASTDDLVRLVGAALTADGAEEALRAPLQQRVDSLLAFASATVAGDVPAQEAAIATSDAATAQFAQALVDVTLTQPPGPAAGIELTTTALRTVAEAWAADDGARARRAAADAHAAVHGLSATVTAALASLDAVTFNDLSVLPPPGLERLGG